jgi:DnaJ-class molecular chaperone
MPNEMRVCPACRGTGEGQTVVIGLGRGVKEDKCRLCGGTGRAKDVSNERPTKAPIKEVRKHVDRFK